MFTALVLAAVVAQTPIDNPRQRRAAREYVVACLGPVARPLVETHDDGAAALLNCDLLTARRLAEFHNQGGLARMPCPATLLRLIATPGNGADVARFAIRHAGELTDECAFAAFRRDPLVYALHLRPLADGAARVRLARSWSGWWKSPWTLVAALGLVLAVALALPTRRRATDPEQPP